jgi:hypothetical protein
MLPSDIFWKYFQYSLQCLLFDLHNDEKNHFFLLFFHSDNFNTWSEWLNYLDNRRYLCYQSERIGCLRVAAALTNPRRALRYLPRLRLRHTRRHCRRPFRRNRFPFWWWPQLFYSDFVQILRCLIHFCREICKIFGIGGVKFTEVRLKSNSTLATSQTQLRLYRSRRTLLRENLP